MEPLAAGRSAPFPLSAGYVRNRAISPDGRFVAEIGYKKLLLWDTASSQDMPRQVGKRVWYADVGPAFSADGSRLVAVTGAQLRVIDSGSGREVLRAGPIHDVRRVLVSPEGRFIATLSVDFSGSGRKVACVRIWDISRKPAAEWKVGEREEEVSLLGKESERAGMRFSPDGRIFANFWSDDQAFIWDVRTREALGRIGSSETGVVDLMFSPDGNVIATVDRFGGSGQRAVRLWDAATLRSSGAPLEDPGGHISNAAFSPDWRLMATVTQPREQSPTERQTQSPGDLGRPWRSVIQLWSR